MPDIHANPASRISDVEARCKAVLASPEFAALPELLAGVKAGMPQMEVVLQTANTGLPLELWERMAQACEKHGIPESGHVLQRFVLLSAGLPNLSRITDLPVADEVKNRLLDQFLYVCAPSQQFGTLLNPRHYGFRVMCKFMRLERFPAGQSDWELSGFPRSWLPKLPLRDMPRTLKCLFRGGGFCPYFVPHTAFRGDLTVLMPEEERKTYRLMAASLRLQPAVKGCLTASWLLDPHLAVVSPHLAWISDWLRECEKFGAVWTTVGEAEKDGGFLVGDRRRRKAYESGQWKPLNGLLLWARADLLDWYSTQESADAGESKDGEARSSVSRF